MRTACIAAGFLLLAGCGKPIPPTAGAPVAATKQPAGQLMLPNASRQFLTVEPLAPGEFSATRTYFGRTAVRPKALSAVTAPFAGRVARVSIEPGQSVRAGATLFTIESPDAMGVRTALSQARLKVRLQEEVLARQTEMVKRGVGLEVERFEAEMKLREARAELERSERNDALPAAGATVQLGGDPLVENGNPGGLWVVADVPEGETSQAAKAGKVEVTVAALNLTLPGRIAGVAPRSDPETRRTPIYIELERAPAD